MEMRAEQLAAVDLAAVPATGGAARNALRTQHA
jgi:hypothetical protein